MSKEMVQIRSVMAYALCVAVALLLGYFLATPGAITSVGVIALVVLALGFPLYMRWHHACLVAAWNSALIVFFLPGQLNLWIVLGMGTLVMAGLRYALDRRRPLIAVPSVTRPLIALMVVVLVTMFFTGGMGGRALGSELWGTKRYVTLMGAILGYFALTSQQIPPKRAKLYAGLFLLSGITAVFSDLAYALGPTFYPLFYLVSSELATLQAMSTSFLERLTGVSWAASAVCYYLLMRYGIRGLCDLRRAWRLGVFTGCVTLGLFGGFRSVVILLFLITFVLFVLEGLVRSVFLPILLMVGLLVGTFLVGFVDRLPLAVQRSLSFLPLRVDPVAKQDALSTLDWRLDMWRVVVSEVPKYLLFGKGYGFDATEYYLTQEAMRRGLYSSYEDTLVSGNYHNGWLTLVIPFSIFGLLAFFWFCWAALKVLYANYRYGPPELERINTYLLSSFVARLVFYLVFYGQFDRDLMVFVGIVGFSISLNGGAMQPARQPTLQTVGVPAEMELVPAA